MGNDKKNDKIFIGTEIKIKRKQKDYTQEKLAELINVSTHTTSYYKCSKNFPSKEHIIQIANILDLSIDESYYGYHKLNENICVDELNMILKRLSPNNQEIAISVMKYLCELLKKTEITPFPDDENTV